MVKIFPNKITKLRLRLSYCLADTQQLCPLMERVYVEVYIASDPGALFPLL